MSARTRTVLAQDWVLWGAVGCALVGTAHSEWSLAVSVGAHPWIAAAVPGALDLYVIRALRQRRDVFVAVLAMVAANVAWYLVHSGDLPIDWPLRSAVGALAPLVLWRVYSLKYSPSAASPAESAVTSADAGAVSAPEVYPPEYVHPYNPDAGTWSIVPQYPAPDAECAPEWARVLHSDTCPAGCECPSALDYAAPEPECVPDHVPAEWAQDECAPNVVHLFPDRPGAAGECALKDGDWPHLPGAQEYLDNCALTDTEPSVRGLRKAIKVGQDRAERLLNHLAEGEKQ